MTTLDTARERVTERPVVALLAFVVAAELLLYGLAPAGAVADAARVVLALAALAVPVVAVATGLGVARWKVAGGLLALPVAVVYAYTGLLLPWTELSFSVGQALIETVLGLPGGGELAFLLFGGWTLTPATRALAADYHYATVALSALALVGPAIQVARPRLADAVTR